MSFKSKLTLDSNFFRPEARKQAFGAAVIQSAKEFDNDLTNKMETGPHTGKITTRGKARGENFRRRHQASKRGERPAPDTNELKNSINSKRTGELSAEVEVAAPHGEILQKGGRLVMTDDDRAEAQQKLNGRLNNALLNLIK